MKSLETLQTTRAEFSIGQAISDGWNIVSKNMGYYILGGILALVIGGTAGAIPYIGGVANNLIVAPCFLAGAIYITWRITIGIPWTDFGDMFKGFNFLQPIALSSLIQAFVSLALVALFFMNYLPQLLDIYDLSQGSDGYANREEIKAIAMQFFNVKALVLFLILLVIFLFISAIWAFKNHFIVIYKMQAWPAMEMSRKIARHNLFRIIGLYLALGFIVLISALPCGIGLLFSLPLTITAMYSAFAQITGSDQTEVDSEMFDFIPPENV